MQQEDLTTKLHEQHMAGYANDENYVNEELDTKLNELGIQSDNRIDAIHAKMQEMRESGYNPTHINEAVLTAFQPYYDDDYWEGPSKPIKWQVGGNPNPAAQLSESGINLLDSDVDWHTDVYQYSPDKPNKQSRLTYNDPNVIEGQGRVLKNLLKIFSEEVSSLAKDDIAKEVATELNKLLKASNIEIVNWGIYGNIGGGRGHKPPDPVMGHPTNKNMKHQKGGTEPDDDSVETPDRDLNTGELIPREDEKESVSVGEGADGD